VALNGAHRRDETFGDLFIGQPCGDQFNDLALTAGQRLTYRVSQRRRAQAAAVGGELLRQCCGMEAALALLVAAESHGRLSGDVRGSGLFIGLELVRDRDTRAPAPEIASHLINRLRHRGILIGVAGPFGNTLKIRPPLCFTRDNADMFIAACDEVLREICPA